jgi:hypothetical protein
MKTSHFDRSQLPPAKNFYEDEVGRLTRPSRGWAKGDCPFHESKSGKSLSVNLDTGAFCCFGCGVRGDMVKFVMIRAGCDFKTAAKSLGAWRGNITADERTEITRREQEREWHRERERKRQEDEKRARLDAGRQLHTTIAIYRETDEKLHKLGPVAEAEPCWALLPPTLDVLRIEESEYCRAAGLQDPYGE